MSNLSRFMKKNKILRENTTYAATSSLVGEDGSPLEWEIKPLSTKENDDIREKCTYEVPIPGKVGVYRQKVNMSEYIGKMLTACVVSPDLNNAELQNSYGVVTPEDLLKELIDIPSEYNDFAMFIQKYNGFDVDINEKIEEVKN